MAAGAGTQMISNHVEGRAIKEGVMSTALISGVTGGIASKAGSSIGNAVSSKVSTRFSRVLLNTGAGALVSATTGALGMLLQNIIKNGKIQQKQFVEYLVSCDIEKCDAESIWRILNQNLYIVDD